MPSSDDAHARAAQAAARAFARDLSADARARIVRLEATLSGPAAADLLFRIEAGLAEAWPGRAEAPRCEFVAGPAAGSGARSLSLCAVGARDAVLSRRVFALDAAKTGRA